MQRRMLRASAAGLIVMTTVALVVACQRKPSSTSSAADSTAAAADSARRVAAGQAAFLANCGMCHGAWGEGDGPLATDLQKFGSAHVARLNDAERIATLGRNEIVRIIREGGGHTGRSNLMPPWSERLPAQTIEDIADFLIALPDLHPVAPADLITRYVQSPPGVPEDGRKLFTYFCTACHGEYGKGDGRYADTLWTRNQIRPRDLTDSTYFAGRTDQDLFSVVSLGGGFYHKSDYMPQWSVTLTPQQIKDLVSYVRALSHTASAP